MRQRLPVAPELHAVRVRVHLLGLSGRRGNLPVHGPAILELVIELHLNLTSERVQRLGRGGGAGVAGRRRTRRRHLLGGGFLRGGDLVR